MDRWEVTLLEEHRDERVALREAYLHATTTVFRGRTVRVTREFIRRLPDLSWQFRYQVTGVEHDEST